MIVEEDPRYSPHSIYGPYKRTRPMTITKRQRFIRWLRQTFSNVIAFCVVYRLYRKHHGRMYSARIAYGCVFRQLPF